MGVYLHDIPLNQAQERFQQALEAAGLWQVLGTERILVDENAVGRVLAEAVWAKISSPHYHASAMDGFAVRAVESVGAMPTAPVTLVAGTQTAYLDTGDPLPVWANAVIPIENVEPLDEDGKPAAKPRSPNRIRIRAAVTPWSHVRPMGEDIVATELVLAAGHTLRAVDLGAIAACGHTEVVVARRPRVGILPTGTELVAVGTPVKAGDIIEYNSIVLGAQVKTWGGEPHRYPITKDDYALIREHVLAAARENDLVLLNAGSSAGAEDFSAGVIGELGEVLVHGVAVRPGHPVILGMAHLPAEGKIPGRSVPVIGAPGYPVSAALTGEIFVEPLLARWLGREAHQPLEVEAQLTRKVTSPGGDDDYMRVALGRVEGKLLAAPLSRGAGVITSLVRADGITILPRGVQGKEAGDSVRVRLYGSPAEADRTIFCIGSHDITLDLLAQFLAAQHRRLASVNAGSLGGLIALRRGEAHLAGSHLLDPDTGEYNLRYIRQYLPETPVRLFHWVGRLQGLMVKRGNPKNIQTLQDLARPDVMYVNRQRGAGTRVLLDYEIGKLGITPEQISGYNEEEYTHLAVAAAISSGRADCGLGIAAAAQALDLDFIPLYSEQYQLVIPRKYLESPLLAPVFELAQNENFRKAVADLPGYEVSRMGEMIVDVG